VVQSKVPRVETASAAFQLPSQLLPHLLSQYCVHLTLQVLHKATALHFEFRSSSEVAADVAGDASRATTTINLPNLDSFTESEHQILAELVKRCKVPAAVR
jgi:hypothetical protein